MKLTGYVLLLSLIGFAIPDRGFAQDQAAPAAGEQQQEMEMVIAEETDRHRVLFAEEGVWDCEIAMFMGPEPMHTTGVETNRRMGLWIISDLSYDMGGVPFSGHGQFTYDSQKEEYVGTWADNVSDSLSMMQGEHDEANSTMTWLTETVGPDGNPVAMKLVAKQVSADAREFAMWIQVPGEEEQWVKGMEIKYTRQQETGGSSSK